MNFPRWARGLVFAISVSAAQPALAADLTYLDFPQAVRAHVPEEKGPWQGISLGLLGTYGFSGGENAVTNLNGMKGLMGGGLVGLHGQLGRWVIGAEFDGTFGSIRDDRNYGRANLRTLTDQPFLGLSRPKRDTGAPALIKPDPLPEQKPNGKGPHQLQSSSGQNVPAAPTSAKTIDRAKASLDELYTLRGRVGYTFNDLLLYATGGVGIAHVKVRAENAQDNYRDQGYGLTPVVGAGAEYRISRELSVRAEYLRLMPFEVAKASFDGAHMVRAVVSYHLPAF
ncbi:outer membrane protein [Rhodoligotrophos ferricapiens]|uniref:outer membrane protein n=1 Tax=Rhodoligotrophos ferricapiens TaxID=3069264 RepID=UPI00315CD211